MTSEAELAARVNAPQELLMWAEFQEIVELPESREQRISFGFRGNNGRRVRFQR